MLPRVKIQFLNGQLGSVGESADGLLALIVGAAAVTTTFALNKPYEVKSIDDLAALGVTQANNPTLYKHVKEFYDEAEVGTKLVIYGVAKATKMTEVLDYSKSEPGYAKALIVSMSGNLRGILVAGLAGEGSNTDGLDKGVFDSIPLAQQLAEWATDTMFAPLFVVLEGMGYDASKTLGDLSTKECNRVAVLVGDTVSGSGACVGTLAGRISSIPVQRNIGRVKDGSLFPSKMYLGATALDESSAVEDIYDKGYIVPRKYVGKTGYYFCDDRLACDPTDDYAQLTARRVIDKAYRLAYTALLDELLDEIELNEDGTLQPAVASSWSQMVENVINRQMTAQGELSGTDGEGCQCYIDYAQNVVSTSRINVVLKVRPFGYSRYVDVSLGFQVTTA